MKKIFKLLLIFMFLLSFSVSAAEAEQVYRGIYFGMSVKEFHDNLRADEKMKLSVGIPEIEIKDTVYNIFALYHEDQLYEIYFETPNYIADYYVEKRLKELNEILEAEYGPADKVNDFEIREVKAEILWQKIWKLEKKRIELGVGKMDTEKYVSLHMLYLPIYEGD